MQSVCDTDAEHTWLRMTESMEKTSLYPSACAEKSPYVLPSASYPDDRQQRAVGLSFLLTRTTWGVDSVESAAKSSIADCRTVGCGVCRYGISKKSVYVLCVVVLF